MQIFLDHFAEILAEDEHAVMVLDGAGWRTTRALRAPPNVTLAPLPPYSPQLHAMERVWLSLRERCLSPRFLKGCTPIVDAGCAAWNAIADDAERIRPLRLYPNIQKVIGSARWHETVSLSGKAGRFLGSRGRTKSVAPVGQLRSRRSPPLHLPQCAPMVVQSR
jgi:hypothetical protein